MLHSELHQHLNSAFDQRDRAEGSGVNVLVLIELDDFKRISLAVGIETADVLAASFHERVRNFLRPCDQPLEISDDRSAVILSGIREMKELDLAAAKLFRQFESPIDLVDRRIHVRVHAAFVMPTKARTGSTELLDEAERGLLTARSDSKRYTVLQPSETKGKRADHWERQLEIETAFEQGEFRLFYQRKVHATCRSTVGAEALLRWMSPEHGLVAPGSFMGYVERSTILKPVTWFCIRAAASVCCKWPAPTSVAVNIAPQVIADDEIVRVLRDTVGFYDLEPERLTIEVVESAMLEDPTRTIEILRAIRELGMKVSIDDFGTGYSSLGQFRDLPADELKVDRSFVAAMADSPRDLSLVRSIVDIAHNFGLQVVAEGVETEQSADTLRDLGCDLLQGYLFGRPCENQEFAAHLGHRAIA